MDAFVEAVIEAALLRFIVEACGSVILLDEPLGRVIAMALVRFGWAFDLDRAHSVRVWPECNATGGDC